jgi:glyoxylase-like metal-dependent hydrolase (beta-lactamase superfamily II)
VAVIDPGPEDPSHLDAVLAAADKLGKITTVIVTHRHLDHLPAALPVCRRTGATLAGHRDLPGVQRPVGDDEPAFGSLRALVTPGHTRDSICLWSPTDAVLFTGDLVLGIGTAVLDDQAGALSDYLSSLERLRALSPRTIYPGHGPIVTDARGKLTEYIEHRRQRVQQVVETLSNRGAATPEELAQAIYADTPANLLPMATRNVRANLDLLAAEQRVRRLDGDRWSLVA